MCNNNINDYAHAYVEVIIVNRKRFTTALIAAMMVGALCLGIAACGGKTPETSNTETETSEITTTTTTTAPTTTLTEYSGPRPNTEEVTWKETQLEAPATYYVKVCRGYPLSRVRGVIPEKHIFKDKDEIVPIEE